jgi:hypothetical protein
MSSRPPVSSAPNTLVLPRSEANVVVLPKLAGTGAIRSASAET